MEEQINSLIRMVRWGMDQGKANMVVNLDVLAEILGIERPEGGKPLYCSVCGHTLATLGVAGSETIRHCSR